MISMSLNHFKETGGLPRRYQHPLLDRIRRNHNSNNQKNSRYHGHLLELRVAESGAECSDHVYGADDVGYQRADCLHSDCFFLLICAIRQRREE